MPGQSTPPLNTAEKKLPSLGTFDLDLHGASYARNPRQATVNEENDSRRSKSNASYTGNVAQPSSPAVLSSSPSTILFSPLSRFPYTTTNHSSSKLTGSTTSILRNHSTATLTNLGCPSIPSLGTLSQSASPSEAQETPISKRRIMFRQPSSASSSPTCSEHNQVPIQRSMPNTPSSDRETGTSFLPLSKKKSSGQLLMGIRKELNRVGSVMRRHNTADGGSGSASSRPVESVIKSAANAGTWRRKKGKIRDAHCKASEKNSPGTKMTEKEGDAGIGRPFNVEHDLHVSPDLSDLPPAWVTALRSQGMSESDFLLITAARQRQRQNTHPLPRHHQDKNDDFFRAPFSAPAAMLEKPLGHGYATDSQSSKASSTGVLKKFSFEEMGPGLSSPSPITLITTTGLGKVRYTNHTLLKDHPFSSESESEGPASDLPSTAEPRSLSPNRTHARGGTDSYPVSATESDTESSPLTHPPLPHSHSHHEPLLPTPSPPSKRLSAQLRRFKGLRIGIDQDEEDWGKSILFAVMDSEREIAGSETSSSGWEMCEPITPRGIPPVSHKTKTDLHPGNLPTPMSDDGGRLKDENETLQSPPPHHTPILSSPSPSRQSLLGSTCPSSLPSSSKEHYGFSHSPLPPFRPRHTPSGSSITKSSSLVDAELLEMKVNLLTPSPSLNKYRNEYGSVAEEKYRMRGEDVHVSLDFDSEPDQHERERDGSLETKPTSSIAKPSHEGLPKHSTLQMQTPSLPAIGMSPLEMNASRFGRSPVSPGIFGKSFGQVQGQKNKREYGNIDMKEDNKDEKEINVLSNTIPLSPSPSYSPLPSSPPVSPFNQHPPPRTSSLSLSQSHHFRPHDSLPVSAHTDSHSSLLFNSPSQENVLGDMGRTSLALSMQSDITWRTSRTSYTAHSLRSWEPVGEATVRVVAYKGLVPRPGSRLWSDQDHRQGGGERSRTPNSPMEQLTDPDIHPSPLPPSPSPYRPQKRPESGGHIESLPAHSVLVHVDVG